MLNKKFYCLFIAFGSKTSLFALTAKMLILSSPYTSKTNKFASNFAKTSRLTGEEYYLSKKKNKYLKFVDFWYRCRSCNTSYKKRVREIDIPIGCPLCATLQKYFN